MPSTLHQTALTFELSPESMASPQPGQHNKESDKVGTIDNAVDEPKSYSEISLARMYGVCLIFAWDLTC
jgi:hypothetical protein